jgi:hypothetical protein
MSQSCPTIVLPGRRPAVLSCLRFDLSVLYVDKSLGFSRVRTECNFSLVTDLNAFFSETLYYGCLFLVLSLFDPSSPKTICFNKII